MRTSVLLPVMVAIVAGTTPALAADGTNAITAADKARIQAQLDSAQKQKLQAGQKQARHTADMAKRDLDAVERKRQQQHAEIDQKSKMFDWKVGPERSKEAADFHKKQADESANAEKAKIMDQAQKKIAAQHAAAKKSAENINQSAEGLKSQVSKDGKFGLQPKGSSLHVRNYGK